MNMDIPVELERARQLQSDGKRREARDVLRAILAMDKRNEDVWMLFYEVAENENQQQQCLRAVLKINPENNIAKSLLADLDNKGNRSTRVPSSNLLIAMGVGVATILLLGGLLYLGWVFLFNKPINPIEANTMQTSKNTISASIAPTETQIRNRVQTSTSTQIANNGKWQITTGKSDFDDSTTVVLSLVAENSIQAWLSTPTPNLIVRCQEKKLAIYVDVRTQINVEYGLNDAATVRVRFDNSPSTDLIADESTDGEGLFFRSPYDILWLIGNSSRMVFGFTPFNASPVVATFDLRGFTNIMKPLNQSCSGHDDLPAPTIAPTPLPTVTPMPAGSSLSVSGLGGKWRVVVDRAEISSAPISMAGLITKPNNGSFVYMYLSVTNLGNEPDVFTDDYQVRLRNTKGDIYSCNRSLSIEATYNLGWPEALLVNPDTTEKRLFIFDIPLTGETYYLVPGSLETDDGQSVVVPIYGTPGY